jgi:hypothetical protein
MNDSIIKQFVKAIDMKNEEMIGSLFSKLSSFTSSDFAVLKKAAFELSTDSINWFYQYLKEENEVLADAVSDSFSLQLKEDILRLSGSYIEEGRILLQVQDSKCYENGYPTFELYCRRELGMSLDYARKAISGYKTYQQLSKTFPEKELPFNKDTIIALLNKKKDIDGATHQDTQQRISLEELWQKVLERCKHCQSVPNPTLIKELPLPFKIENSFNNVLVQSHSRRNQWGVCIGEKKGCFLVAQGKKNTLMRKVEVFEPFHEISVYEKIIKIAEVNSVIAQMFSCLFSSKVYDTSILDLINYV